MEIRAGEGGKDSKLFIHDLFAAYCKYAYSKNLQAEILDSADGIIVGRFFGTNAGAIFMWESGKHTLQRVPPTERGGRRQTSVVTVAVLPIPPENHNSLLPECDLEIVAFKRSAGAGGQKINKTASAVRVVHKSTKIQVVICTERSQHQNRQIALRMIAAKVNQEHNSSINSSYAQNRREQVGNGGRGDKIRTYNFIDSRAVDHRTNKKSNVSEVIGKGKFDLLV